MTATHIVDSLSEHHAITVMLLLRVWKFMRYQNVVPVGFQCLVMTKLWVYRIRKGPQLYCIPETHTSIDSTYTKVYMYTCMYVYKQHVPPKIIV